ncbi:DUF4884 domain-containing protein [Massilibacteroides vaginae]|uniref:DUF4884 domain-containing protein n=1 Tax=Massilibacteroides vaginae TaxID=1673718 RepID=UPI000A1CD997|nr:DUF4884 domain-containing protein [Massilibacteroides vaginae]
MKHTILLSSLFFVLTFLSCGGVPLLTTESDNNKSYTVEYLFEHDGCKVYRFMDRGEYVYFTNCNGSVTSATSDSTHVKIQNTVRVNPVTQ